MTDRDGWGPREPLPARLAGELRTRLNRGEWAAGDRLPTEFELVDEYRVSRATVRQALKILEAHGLVQIHHGRGTFVIEGADVRAGLQELKSNSALIAEMGYTPSVRYHHRRVRPATPEEASRLDVEPRAKVLDIQVRMLADSTTVAYSYDILPMWLFPEGFQPSDLTGSVIAFLEEHGGPVPIRAVAQVHAVSDPAVAWDKKVPEDQLFVLLDQVQYDKSNRPIIHSRSYFIEGRFNFTVVRTAPAMTGRRTTARKKAE